MKRTVAYVGTYTRTRGVGIHIYDIKDHVLVERGVVPVHNPSDLHIQKSKNMLYSIADEGVVSFKIASDGDLIAVNDLWIGGMRGCDLESDEKGRYLFVAGNYDGSVTVVKLGINGELEGVVDTVYHKAMGVGVAKRGANPTVTCVRLTPDERFLCAVDSGLDQIFIYEINYETGELTERNRIRGHLESAPRNIRFSTNYKYAYVLCELSRCVDVYAVSNQDTVPEFDLIETIKTTEVEDGEYCSAADFKLSKDETTLLCSNAGSNSVAVFTVDCETGAIHTRCNLKISGSYPKAVSFLPDQKHFVTLNQETDEIVTFKMEKDDRYFLMEGRPIKIHTPNCIKFLELEN